MEEGSFLKRPWTPLSTRVKMFFIPNQKLQLLYHENFFALQNNRRKYLTRSQASRFKTMPSLSQWKKDTYSHPLIDTK